MNTVPFKKPEPRQDKPSTEFDIRLRAEAVESLPQNVLEDAAEAALDVLVERAANTVLGPAVGCDFSAGAIEIEFTIEADSIGEVHKHLADVMRLLESDGPMELQDSSASRVRSERAVPA